MQRVLEQMARKLSAYDEASLMQLWQQYAAQVHDFEPTKRWEEATLVLCLIQAVHWKNQLFNYHLALTARPADKGAAPPLPDFFANNLAAAKEKAPSFAQRATVLPFPGKHEADHAGGLLGKPDGGNQGVPEELGKNEERISKNASEDTQDSE